MSEVNNLVSPAVENHLKKLLEHLNIYDYSINISPGTIKGDNFLGIIANVQVRGKNQNDEKTTMHLIVKSAPCKGIFRERFPIRTAYEREIYFYSKVLPEFNTLQEEKRIAKPFNSFAKFYNSTMDDLNEALVMENMKEHGFKLWSRFEPVDYNHALLVMRNYGKLHAFSFALKDQKPKLFNELAGNTREAIVLEKNRTPQKTEYMKRQVRKALTALDPVEHKEAYERLEKFQDVMMNKIYTALKFEEAEPYSVIGHGDCWINNMLFKYEDSERPTEVCFLDWQLSRSGSPALDLGYFIFTCTDKDLRDKHYPDLLQEYYISLCIFLRELGSDPEKLFPREALQDHLKRFSVYGLHMAIILLHFITSEVEEIPDVHNITDIKDAVENFSYLTKNVDKYRSRIRGVVLDFLKYDYDF